MNGGKATEWDKALDLNRLWAELDRIIKPNGKIILFGMQKFFCSMVMAAPSKFKFYEMVWDKCETTGFLNANRQPLRQFENIAVFYTNQGTYNPQMLKFNPATRLAGREHKRNGMTTVIPNTYGKTSRKAATSSCDYYPSNLIRIPNDAKQCRLHPTSKPVSLMSYLIMTFSNKGDVVADFTMGAGSTGVAAVSLERQFVGSEINPEFFNIAKSRIEVT
jgi:site-specific DNA-methyltransferase (adenine-specific)